MGVKYPKREGRGTQKKEARRCGGERRKESVRRKVGGEKEENPNSRYWFSRESGNLPSADEGVKKMWFSSITEYHSALEKNETCHLNRHRWTWGALC